MYFYFNKFINLFIYFFQVLFALICALCGRSVEDSYGSGLCELWKQQCIKLKKDCMLQLCKDYYEERQNKWDKMWRMGNVILNFY